MKTQTQLTRNFFATSKLSLKITHRIVFYRVVSAVRSEEKGNGF